MVKEKESLIEYVLENDACIKDDSPVSIATHLHVTKIDSLKKMNENWKGTINFNFFILFYFWFIFGLFFFIFIFFFFYV